MASPAVAFSPLPPSSCSLSSRGKDYGLSSLQRQSLSPLPNSHSRLLSSRPVEFRPRKPRNGFSLPVASLPPSPSPSGFPLDSRKLYVSGLSFRTTEESLTSAFEKFGRLVDVNLVMDRVANRPRGFAFLRYAAEEESRNAIEEMHGKVRNSISDGSILHQISRK